MIGGVLVYKDLTHITSEYGKTLAPYLEREVRRLKIKGLLLSRGSAGRSA